jgi:RhoGEF domain
MTGIFPSDGKKGFVPLGEDMRPEEYVKPSTIDLIKKALRDFKLPSLKTGYAAIAIENARKGINAFKEAVVSRAQVTENARKGMNAIKEAVVSGAQVTMKYLKENHRFININSYPRFPQATQKTAAAFKPPIPPKPTLSKMKPLPPIPSKHLVPDRPLPEKPLEVITPTIKLDQKKTEGVIKNIDEIINTEVSFNQGLKNFINLYKQVDPKDQNLDALLSTAQQIKTASDDFIRELKRQVKYDKSNGEGICSVYENRFPDYIKNFKNIPDLYSAFSAKSQEYKRNLFQKGFNEQDINLLNPIMMIQRVVKHDQLVKDLVKRLGSKDLMIGYEHVRLSALEINSFKKANDITILHKQNDEFKKLYDQFNKKDKTAGEKIIKLLNDNNLSDLVNNYDKAKVTLLTQIDRINEHIAKMSNYPEGVGQEMRVLQNLFKGFKENKHLPDNFSFADLQSSKDKLTALGSNEKLSEDQRALLSQLNKILDAVVDENLDYLTPGPMGLFEEALARDQILKSEPFKKLISSIRGNTDFIKNNYPIIKTIVGNDANLINKINNSIEKKLNDDIKKLQKNFNDAIKKFNVESINNAATQGAIFLSDYNKIKDNFKLESDDIVSIERMILTNTLVKLFHAPRTQGLDELSAKTMDAILSEGLANFRTKIKTDPNYKLIAQKVLPNVTNFYVSHASQELNSREERIAELRRQNPPPPETDALIEAKKSFIKAFEGYQTKLQALLTPEEKAATLSPFFSDVKDFYVSMMREELTPLSDRIKELLNKTPPPSKNDPALVSAKQTFTNALGGYQTKLQELLTPEEKTRIFGPFEATKGLF